MMNQYTYRGLAASTRCLAAALTVVGLAGLNASEARSAEDLWPAYLDYAYVYSSADAASLRARLAEYGTEAGLPLGDYVARAFASGGEDEHAPFDEEKRRREAIGFLLLYLADGEPEALDRSIEAISALDEHLGRHENRYWYHYIMAQRALERGDSHDFVAEVLDLWLGVVVPLEAPYDTLHALALSDSPNSGFVAALPYVFENISRLVLIRSQEMGMQRGLDPLAAVVRMLYDGRVGAHPDVIPPEASSFDYLDRIVARLDGPESDAGSLTFTLALFEASKLHDRSRGLLAAEDLSAETVRAIELAASGYEVALNRAETVGGQAAVYTRVLRQLGEVYAAKQRLGVDPELGIPFTIEGAIEVYGELQRGLDRGWGKLGFRAVGYEAYLATLHGLWAEIQETSLNAADYYLARSVNSRFRADEHARNAARVYDRYVAFFLKYAKPKDKAGVPESAYFAAYEAARGYGDAMLRYGSGKPTRAEIELATQRYKGALQLFPFDRTGWSAMTAGLEKQGRESDYLELSRPVADAVTRSRVVDNWVSGEEPGYQIVRVFRQAFADPLVLMYLGFSQDNEFAKLEASLEELRASKLALERELTDLGAERDRLDGTGSVSSPAAPSPDLVLDQPSLGEVKRRYRMATDRLVKLEQQIERRTRSLPLYESVLATGDLGAELRAGRNHPAHTLLRRMYYENRGGSVAANR